MREALVRAYVRDEQEPGGDIDVGRLPEEDPNPFADWIEAMGWVENDALGLAKPTEGWLWIHDAVPDDGLSFPS